MTMKAAIYARYSTERQDARSLDDQVRRCREYALRTGIEVVGSYEDAATSGATLEREHFQRLLADAKRSKGRAFNAVLVDDLSRLARDLFKMGQVVFEELAGCGVRVIDCMTGTASDSQVGRQVFTAMGTSADLFLQMVKSETHRGLESRALGGFWTGGRVYGYRIEKEKNPPDPEHPRSLLFIDDLEAKIVRWIFTMYGEGRGFASIAHELNRDGVRAPYDRGGYGKPRGHGWQASTIRAILTNERYIGRFVWNKRRFLRRGTNKTRSAQTRDESEWRVQERPELAIITAQQWEAARSRIQVRRGRPAGESNRKNPRVHLLSGIARCGDCGAGLTIIGQRTKNGVTYCTLGCSKHYTRGSSICANAATISERKLNSTLVDELKAHLLRPGAITAFVEKFEKFVREGRPQPNSNGERNRAL